MNILTCEHCFRELKVLDGETISGIFHAVVEKCKCDSVDYLIEIYAKKKELTSSDLSFIFSDGDFKIVNNKTNFLLESYSIDEGGFEKFKYDMLEDDVNNSNFYKGIVTNE